MSLIKKFFVEFDLFCALPTLRARGESETMNLCGGIVSLLLLSTFIYVFIINFINTVNFKEMEIIELEKVSRDGCRNFKVEKEIYQTYILLSDYKVEIT